MRRLGVVSNASEAVPMEPPTSYAPSVLDVSYLESYVVRGQKVVLKTAVVIQPPLVTAFGVRRWLEEYSPPPRSKATQKRLRLTLIDSILAVARALRDVAVLAAVGHGEIHHLHGLQCRGQLAPSHTHHASMLAAGRSRLMVTHRSKPVGPREKV